MGQLLIECVGKHWDHLPEVETQVKGQPLRLVFAPELKRGLGFHAAMFLNYAAHTREVMAYAPSRRFAVLGEPGSSRAFLENPERLNAFSLILTHDPRILEICAHARELPFGTNWIDWPNRAAPQAPKSKLVSFMGARHPQAAEGSGHGFRNQVIEALLARGGVDCFGKGIRYVDSICDSLEGYACSVVMENSQREGYFTEKLINCFLMESLPIYWGCSNIERYFDKRGMIVFDSLDELDSVLSTLSWEDYAQRLPYIRANRTRAIEARWATLADYYKRAAEAFVEHAACPARGSWVRPKLVRFVLNRFGRNHHG